MVQDIVVTVTDPAYEPPFPALEPIRGVCDQVREQPSTIIYMPQPGRCTGTLSRAWYHAITARIGIAGCVVAQFGGGFEEHVEMTPQPAMGIGINARLFPNNWRPTQEEIAFAQANAFTAIQFSDRKEGLTAGRLGDPLPVVAAALRATHLVAALEIIVRISSSGRTLTGRTPLDVIEANLEAITTLPCAYVHWHLVPITPLDELALHALEDTLIPQFEAAVALAQQHSFRFAFEHNEPLVGLHARPDRCRRLLDAVPGLGFVWDINHTIPEHVPDFLALAPRMTMLHVSDTPLPQVNHHLPLGLGSVDLEAYCQAVIARGFRGPAILEIGGLPHSGGYGRDTDAALIDSRRRLAAAVAGTGRHRGAGPVIDRTPGQVADCEAVVPDRPRVSAAVLRNAGREVLMVRHRRRDGTTYWQLPGGGILPGEQPEDAVLRELGEETGLAGTVVRCLFTIPYRLGTSTTFLVDVDQRAQVALGCDPEETAADHRKLVDVAWLSVADLRENPEISALLRVL